MHEGHPLDPALSCSGRCDGTNSCYSRLCTYPNADYSQLLDSVKATSSVPLQAQCFLKCPGRRRGINLPDPHLHEYRHGKSSWEAAVDPGYNPCSSALQWMPPVSCVLLGCMEPYSKPNPHGLEPRPCVSCAVLCFTGVPAGSSSTVN